MCPIPTPWQALAPRCPANLDDFDIIQTYGAEHRGIIGYYLLAHDVWRLTTLQWYAKTSMLKTLAAKYQSTVSKMATKHKTTINTPHGLRTCFEARIHREGTQDLVARFGGTPLAHKKNAVLTDRAPGPVPTPRKELLRRLLARRCELCKHVTNVVIHQVRKLASLGTPGPNQPKWATVMATMRRKTLAVRAARHDVIHHNPVTQTA
jgi:hypothetical protein